MIRIRIVLLLLAYSIALLGFIPLFLYLESFPRLLFIAAFAAGVLFDYRNRYLPSLVTTVVSVLFFLYFGFQFSTKNLVGPAANTIILLLGVRLLSEKSVRNHLQIYVLALIALAASSLYSLDAVFLVYLLVQLVLITVSLVLLTFHGKDPQMNLTRPAMKKILAVSLLMPLVTIPLTVLFFVILPRTQYPLWQFVQKPADKVTGFSEKVEPGTASSTVAEKTVAFRVESTRLGDEQLYWRGIVLNQIMGDTWVRLEPPAGEITKPGTGSVIRQTIYPEPSRSRYLVTLNMPRDVTGIRTVASTDLVFGRFYQTQRRIGYRVVSVSGTTIPTVREIHRKFYLKLPATVSSRMRDLARDLRRHHDGDRQILAGLGEYFRQNRYTYLTSTMPTGGTSIDSFLFEKRRGNCELFAVSAATLLRLAGVPTRLVGGYFGGDYNPIGGYYTVTEDMAHVWLEVYQEGEGWVTVDPTRWAANGVVGGRNQQDQLLRQLRLYVDLLGYYWNRAVITYDLEKQISLVVSANQSLKELKPSALKVPLTLVLILSVLMAIAPYLRRYWKRTAEEKILADFFAVIGKRYSVNDPPGSIGLCELSEKTGSPLVRRFVSLYGGAVYRGRRLTVEERRELAEMISSIGQEGDPAPGTKGAESPHKP